jgi:hypothetical protein
MSTLITIRKLYMGKNSWMYPASVVPPNNFQTWVLHSPSTNATDYKFEPNYNPTEANSKNGNLAHVVIIYM